MHTYDTSLSLYQRHLSFRPQWRHNPYKYLTSVGAEPSNAACLPSNPRSEAFNHYITETSPKKDAQVAYYSKTCLKRSPKKKAKNGLKNRSSLYAGQKYCRMLQDSILQYFRPSLSYHLSLRYLFCLFLSGRFRQVLLYIMKPDTAVHSV